MSEGNGNGNGVPHLIVNRAEVVTHGCIACGKDFAVNPTGERALTASVGEANDTYMFCAQCGDSIMGHLQADKVRERYGWDWLIPLRGAALNGASH
jgi:hypothetical protein